MGQCSFDNLLVYLLTLIFSHMSGSLDFDDEVLELLSRDKGMTFPRPVLKCFKMSGIPLRREKYELDGTRSHAKQLARF